MKFAKFFIFKLPQVIKSLHVNLKLIELFFLRIKYVKESRITPIWIKLKIKEEKRSYYLV